MQAWPQLSLRVFFSAAIFFSLAAGASAQAPFFQGKTITILHGRDPGGSGDLRVKAVTAFLQKYIPGHPTIIHEYMAGGGGRKATNHLFRSSRPDGLTIGNMSSGMVSLAILGESGVLYDIDKFIYLGSPYSQYHSVFLTRKEAGFTSLAKLQAAPGVRIGAQSVGFSTYNEARLFAYLLRLKEPKFIPAYSGAELDPALMRGEVDARATGADSIVQRNREWYEKKLVDFHAIMEVPKGDKHPLFANLPELESFAKSERDRKMLTMQRAFRVAGAPFILPPNTPKDRVEILQEAFRKTFRDPEFHKEYKKLTGDDPSPLMPEAHEKTIREIPRDAETVELVKQIVGAGPLPQH
jgi:tripartite-type tricarboxylate transporter receptor subunit TctC